ncbi:MAG: hypothetical protein K9N51_01970 [Candidatus Pacebacteria bacterium]|nr:hypothetical protein [Candidatus Paceibacterota bacterium]
MGVTKNEDSLVLSNPWILRELNLSSSGPATTRFAIRPSGSDAEPWLPVFAFDPQSPFEASVVVNGKTRRAGPHDPGNPEWTIRGGFDVVSRNIAETPLGTSVTVGCASKSERAFPEAVELKITYEIAEEFPLLIKSVEVTNTGDEAFQVENITVETCPSLRLGSEFRVFTDFYDYWPVSRLDEESRWHRWEFPKPIHYRLLPGESIESFRCFETAVPNEPEAASIVTHRVLKALAPWITRPLISQQISDCSSFSDLAGHAVSAAENGIECVHFFVDVTNGGMQCQLFTNCGDYRPRPDLFPSGEDDLKRLVDIYRKHGVRVATYCALTIAWSSSHIVRANPDWQYLGPGGIRYQPERFGNMCYQSGWGDYIREKLLHLVDDIGFDGLQIDGPYHGLPCCARDHKHGSSDSVPFMNWRWERAFFQELLERDVYIASPQSAPASYLLGNCARPGGYTEEDYQVLCGMPLIIATRARLYDGLYSRPASGAWGFLAFDDYHGNSMGISDRNPELYDHALGGLFGLGYWGFLHGRRLYCSSKTKRIFERWTRFYKDHVSTLAGECVHLARPDGMHPDGVMHVAPHATPPAVVVLFNPRAVTAAAALALPLGYAGFEPGGLAEIESIGRIKLDSRATGLATVTLLPWEVKTLDIQKVN